MSRTGAATGNAPAGGVASTNENNSIKAKEKTIRHVSSQRMRRPGQLERRAADKTDESRRFIYPPVRTMPRAMPKA